jgi:hypothetical protein
VYYLGGTILRSKGENVVSTGAQGQVLGVLMGGSRNPKDVVNCVLLRPYLTPHPLPPFVLLAPRLLPLSEYSVSCMRC